MINLLEFLEMVATAWVMLGLVGDRPDAEGDPILMRGDNLARCRGSLDAAGRGMRRRAYS